MKRILGAVMASLMLCLFMAQPSVASTSPGLSDKRARILYLTNKARASKCGANSLILTNNANTGALYHADDMVDENYFSHDSQNPYWYWVDRIEHFVVRQAGGENIAYGYTTADSVFNAWMASSSHYRNIMDCSFAIMGVGYAEDSTGDRKWVQDFIYP